MATEVHVTQLSRQLNPGPSVPLDLARAVEYCRALVSALPEATVMVVGADETVWAAEGKLLERHGYHASAIAGMRLADILPASTGAALRESFHATLTQGTQSFDYRTADGQTRCWIHQTPMYCGEQSPAAVIAVIQDVTHRHRLTAELQTERERLARAEEMARCGHWEVDVHTQTVTLSAGAVRLLGGVAPATSSLRRLLSHVDDAHRQRVIDALCTASHAGMGECECVLHGTDGTPRRVLMRGTRTDVAAGREVIAGTIIDISQLRAAEEARGESEALFQEGFDRSPIGMALTDADSGRYLQVNDALCRLLGRSRDQLLQLRFSDVSHPADADLAEVGMRAMISGAAPDLDCEKRYVRPDGSVVWAAVHVMPVFGRGRELRGFLSQVVDLTMHKEREQQLIQEAAGFARLAEIRAALAEDRLVLHAQPIMDLHSGQLVQQELLVRLRQRDGQIMPPEHFLPVAERYGAIKEIDHWVTHQALALAASGQPVEVNLSAASVGNEELLSTIRDTLTRSGADPALLVFEVTETALMADLDRGRRFGTALRDLGCQFALDDFGTGYGTFTYLKHIPIDHIKIDIEFVRDLLSNQDDERLVQAIVTMAHDLGKKTTAEGVENAATLDRLRELGVDYAQGYHIGRPAEITLPTTSMATALHQG
jgi:PAS domain S-box-containing protein